jgi:hypothetical protein
MSFIQHLRGFCGFAAVITLPKVSMLKVLHFAAFLKSTFTGFSFKHLQYQNAKLML